MEAPAAPVCVVVGLGNKGIGDHCAMKWSAEGYQVAMLARRKEVLDALEKEIPNSKGYQCDVCVPEQIEAAVGAIGADLGPIRAVVYNAGSGVFKALEDCSFDEFEAAWRTGPAGLFCFAKLVVPAMVASGGGGFFAVTGATASWRGVPKTPAFASAKFGARALAQALAKTYAPQGVHVFHCVIDGVVLQPRTRAWFAPDKPEDEFLNPKTIAEHYWSVATQEKSCWTFESNVCCASRMGDMLTI